MKVLENYKELLGEKFDEVSKAVQSEVDKLVKEGGADYIPKLKYNEVKQAKDELKELLEEKNKKLSELDKLSEGNQELQKQLQNMQTENEKALQDMEAKRQKTLLHASVQKYNPLSAKAVLAEIDTSKLEYGEDEVKGLEEQVKALQEDDTLKGLFKQETPKPAGTGVKQNPDSDYDMEKGSALLEEARRAAKIN